MLVSGPVYAEDTPPEDEEAVEQDDASDDTDSEEDMALQEPEHYKFEKDGCDFTAVFPEPPYTSKRCNEPAPGDLTRSRDCYDVVSYTQVYDMTTTVNISLSCNKSSKTAYEQYSEAVMRTTLEGMAYRNDLDDAKVGYKQYDGINMASLSGTGTTGRQSQIYVAQLWVSENSVLSVEAQLIGEARPDADKTFSEILRSITPAGTN